MSLRASSFVLGLGSWSGCVIVACSSFSTSEPAESRDSAADDGGPDEASVASIDGGDGAVDAGTGFANCDAGAGSRACTDRYVFTTLDTLPGDFAVDGGSPFAIADAFCRTDANQQANHPDLKDRAWHAWLCTETANANGRVATTPARWITPDGVVVFEDTQALQATAPGAQISKAPRLWTGCTTTGFSAAACDGWTNGSSTGYYGVATQTDQSWSSYATQGCANRAPVYCFEATR